MNWHRIYLALLKVTKDEAQARAALIYLMFLEDT